MNQVLRLPLQPTPAQVQTLQQLQTLFAKACNVVSEHVQNTHCWNRVALHHLCYRQVRQAFPELGAQMACNAIYSVCRAARWAYQHPASPMTAMAQSGSRLPKIMFLSSSPVYFDRHTLSIKGHVFSMFTLDGRLHFQIELGPQARALFLSRKLKEVALIQSPRFGQPKTYELVCWFVSDDQTEKLVGSEIQTVSTSFASDLCPVELAVGTLDRKPDYLQTEAV